MYLKLSLRAIHGITSQALNEVSNSGMLTTLFRDDSGPLFDLHH